ncbi:GNAT family N-acetyltransferase [Streptosporangium sp. CA-135522]|uniref:GNAT family N-acetyltransferase n=1 Tax=Streptosporangium sp. CA-135522 TaxID=3240072 RepID=UPI003D927283
MNWLIHDYREDDLAAVVHLIDMTAGLGQESVFSLAECISALTSRQPAVVAVHRGAPIGAALAHVTGERAWVMRIAIASAWRGRGLASALLRELERRLVDARVRRIAYVLPEEELLGEGLVNAGYTRRPAVAYSAGSLNWSGCWSSSTRSRRSLLYAVSAPGPAVTASPTSCSS